MEEQKDMRVYNHILAPILAASDPYGWLENDGSEQTTGSDIFTRLFGNGTVASLYRFFLKLGTFALLVYLFMLLIKWVLRANEPMAHREVKSSFVRWFMCVVAFYSVLGIAGLALKIGGAF